MREIKFRGWNPNQKEWSFKELEAGEEVWFDPDCIIMQYTGLHDKNGKEIYEGDILASSNSDTAFDLWSAEDMGYTVIKWDDDDVGFSGTAWFPEVSQEQGESVYGIQFVEVIGNIYENPEVPKP